MKIINIFMIIGQIGFVEPRTDLVRSKITLFDVLPLKLGKNSNENELPQKKSKTSKKISKDRKNRRRIKNDTRNRKRSENRRRRNSKRRYRSRLFARGDF